MTKFEEILHEKPEDFKMIQDGEVTYASIWHRLIDKIDDALQYNITFSNIGCTAEICEEFNAFLLNKAINVERKKIAMHLNDLDRYNSNQSVSSDELDDLVNELEACNDKV